MKNILIVRLSSFGDIVQCLTSAKLLKTNYPDCKISFVTKREFANLVELCEHVDQVISFDKKLGLVGWIKLCFSIRNMRLDLIYDAHSNMRTSVLKLILLGQGKVITRNKERIKRLLLFKFRVNKFPRPFRGMQSFCFPLIEKLGLRHQAIEYQKFDFSKVETKNIDKILPQNEFLAIAPSAAWKMKTWPLDHWKQLIKILDSTKVVVLGGPADTFCQELEELDSNRVFNLAGKLSLIESCYVIERSHFFVSADTGLIHVNEILGKYGASLIGPTAFGFPST